jgi:hypothetical protein
VSGTEDGFLMPPIKITVYTRGATHIADGHMPAMITLVRTPETNVGVQVY